MTNDENSEAEKNPPAAMASPPESVAAMIAAAGKSMDEATARRMAAERLNFLAPGCAYPELGPDELLGTGDQSADYHRGRRAMAANILGSCLRELGVNDPIAARSAWVMERQGAIRVLRDVCAEYGDNDWPDSLVLEDVIEKHLHRNLDDSFKDEEFDDAGDGDTEAPLNLAGWGLDLFDSILDNLFGAGNPGNLGESMTVLVPSLFLSEQKAAALASQGVEVKRVPTSLGAAGAESPGPDPGGPSPYWVYHLRKPSSAAP
jgi:hypothetical protein